MKPKELMEKSLGTHLNQRLTKIEGDLYLLAKKYGVKDVFELDSKMKEGIT